MKKLLLILTFALAFAGVFVFTQVAHAEVKPWNVDVCVSRGGTSVRYDLSRHIDADDDAEAHAYYGSAKIKRAKCQELLALGLPQEAVFEYVLPGFRNVCQAFSFVNEPKVDATVTFDKSGFHYAEGHNGTEIDQKALFFAMIECSSGQKVELPIITHKAVTVAELKARTVLKGKFSTSISASGANRRHNVRTAARSLDGLTILPSETFSFNGVVGERSVENGYKTAKVILDGAYRDGVGGGVCQVSTTMYNALLLAEIVPKARSHSLVPSYVMAGFDAMVSYGSSDMTFTNDGDSPLYVSAKVNGDWLTFSVFGAPNEYTVRRENQEVREPFSVVEVVGSERYPELIYSDQTLVVQNGSDGVKSRSFLVFYDGDKPVRKIQIRTDSYKKVDKIIARGATSR